MFTLNKVFMMGRLTRDPELRYTPQGVPVSDLGLAVNREFTAQGSGERKKDTLFIDVTVWRKHAELCCQHLRKGSPLFIEGRLAMDSWEGQDGQKRSKIRVVAENFQFVGGTKDVPGEAPTEGVNGERSSSGDYGASYRRGPGGPAPSGAQTQTPPPVEDFPAPQEDVPF